ncbi:MAG TPA: dNTP triphosphohydrolase [Saprospiraceae bacterium]|nr:dNTP triphosphohydrolase [Saprospiraceae bacterium]HPK09852.1 dNTP triphosphohydrolase [Saprospiraceae bacterium]HPQ21308.1 dNTP triphosphohydrolase [Saprospiraceae bacterium]
MPNSWEQAYSSRRTGNSSSSDALRTDFQRDFDRMIFSAAFRRLQNKTQIFPLPGNTFVHNRLTHSLEVASVGRSLGHQVGNTLAHQIKENSSKQFYQSELSNVIAAGCLAHDIGNPAYGHSGEEAISDYFKKNANKMVNGHSLASYFNEKEWNDLTHFEGNANAFRLLTHHYRGKYPGGFGLTYSTLASILKYPCESSAKQKGKLHRKKYGFFQSELTLANELAQDFNMESDLSTDYISYYRHPFVYLVEAADDICYRIIDLEDAHKIGIISFKEIVDLYFSVIEQVSGNKNYSNKTKESFDSLGDKNEKISYLRAKSIGSLVEASQQHFIDHEKEVLHGKLNCSLLDLIDEYCPVMKDINDISIHKIYNHSSVIELEVTGYKVLFELLDIFTEAAFDDDSKAMNRKTKLLIPEQFAFYKDENTSPYEKVMGVIDFVSGMTDEYSTSLYRKLMGIDLSRDRRF